MLLAEYFKFDWVSIAFFVLAGFFTVLLVGDLRAYRHTASKPGGQGNFLMRNGVVVFVIVCIVAVVLVGARNDETNQQQAAKQKIAAKQKAVKQQVAARAQQLLGQKMLNDLKANGWNVGAVNVPGHSATLLLGGHLCPQPYHIISEHNMWYPALRDKDGKWHDLIPPNLNGLSIACSSRGES